MPNGKPTFLGLHLLASLVSSSVPLALLQVSVAMGLAFPSSGSAPQSL